MRFKPDCTGEGDKRHPASGELAGSAGPCIFQEEDIVSASLRRGAMIATLAALAALSAGSGLAQAARSADSGRPWLADGAQASSSGAAVNRSGGLHHNGLFNHLPPARENMEVVSRLEMTAPFGNVLEGQIADLSVYKGWAYLMSWSPKDNAADLECKRGGVFVVDIRDPAAPKQQTFIPALPATYHGEGAHTTTINTPAFQGDILAVNNEPCGGTTAPSGPGTGGFDLYDVSDPTNPKTLVQGVGDQSPDDNTLVQNPTEIPNSNHSIFIWQQGPRAYAVTVDNTELHDVDIFDITNPSGPVFIADLDLEERFPEIVANSANGNTVFHHDAVVKQIDGRPVMLVNYWDAGYVQLDVSDPANPTLITDTDFPDFDPLVTLTPPGAPEGNAHQGEFSHDNQFILAADEDFATYRPVFQIVSGSFAGNRYPAGEFGFSIPIKTLSDSKLNGPVIFGGYGCDASPQPIPPATSLPALDPGEEKIVVVQRGPAGDPAHAYTGCRFDEKMQNAIDAGYDGIIIAQRHLGSEAQDGAFCGSGDPRAIRGMCVSHKAMHDMFNDPPNYAVPYPPDDAPAIGTVGAEVEAISQFDGWGYAHLYDAKTSALIDDYSIPEAIDERYATGFGDLSIHEFATDPETNLAYAAWYSGGMRVFRFSRAAGLEPMGKFIAEEGSNFWGVEQFTAPNGERLIAGSDRDYGLYIFRYTGPGAVGPRATTTTTTTTNTVPVAVKPPSSFFRFGAIKRLTIRNGRATMRITVPGSGRATGALKARIGRTMVTLGTARATATRAGSLTLRFRVSAAKQRSLRRAVRRRPSRLTSGVARVSFSRAGGFERTRNRALAIGIAR